MGLRVHRVRSPPISTLNLGMEGLTEEEVSAGHGWRKRADTDAAQFGVATAAHATSVVFPLVSRN